MTPPRTAMAALVVLAAAGVAMVAAMGPAATPGSDFSAARAGAEAAAVADVAHPVGSAAHERIRDHLVDRMTALGWQASVVTATAANPRLGAPFPIGRVADVVAELPGTSGAGVVYVDAHYDSVSHGPGANDDAVPVAGLLEVARALAAGPRLRNTVVFVFSDAEEPGMLGVRGFLAARAPAPAAAVVLNLEARGAGGPPVMFETSTANRGVAGVFGQVRQPLGFSLSYEVYKRLPNDTDFTEWRAAGFTGLNFAYLDRSPYYHSGADTLDHVDTATVAAYGDQDLRLVRAFGDADLARLDTGSDTYFWLPFVLVAYPGWLAGPLAGLALVALVVLAWLARRRDLLTWRGVGVSAAWFLVPLVAAPAFAAGLWALAGAVRPEYATLVLGDPYRPGWYRAGLVAAALTAAAGWFLAVGRRHGPLAPLVAGLALPAALGAVTAVVAPGASYLFALPVLVTAGGLAAVIARSGQPARWPLVAGALVAVAVAVPVVALLLSALGVALGPLTVLLVVLVAVPALPLVDLAVVGRRRLVVAVAGALSVALFATGLATDRVDTAHPRLSSLVYALDADTGRAEWLSADPAPNAWNARYVAGPARPVESRYPALVGPFLERYLTGPAPVATLAAPELTVLADTRDGDARTLHLRLRSARGAPVVWLHLATGTRLTAATVDGLTVPATVTGPTPGGDWGWGFGFYALPADGVEVDLIVAGSTPLRVRVVDQSDGLTGIAGYVPPPATVTWSALPSDEVYVGRTVTL